MTDTREITVRSTLATEKTVENLECVVDAWYKAVQAFANAVHQSMGANPTAASTARLTQKCAVLIVLAAKCRIQAKQTLA